MPDSTFYSVRSKPKKITKTFLTTIFKLIVKSCKKIIIFLRRFHFAAFYYTTIYNANISYTFLLKEGVHNIFLSSNTAKWGFK